MWPSDAVVSPWEWSVRRIPSWDLPDKILVLFLVPLSRWPPSWHVRVTTQWHVSRHFSSHVSPHKEWRRSAAVNQEVLFAGRRFWFSFIAINEDPLRLDPMTNYDWSSRPKRVNCDLTLTEPRLRWKVKINFYISENGSPTVSKQQLILVQLQHRGTTHDEILM